MCIRDSARGALLFKVTALQLPHAPLALFEQQYTFVLSINIKNQSNIKKYTIVKLNKMRVFFPYPNSPYSWDSLTPVK